MVAGGNDVRHTVVEAFHAVRRPLPHLPTGLVGHGTVGYEVVVLLHKVARKEHGTDVELPYVVGAPGGTEFVERLVAGILGVALGVAHENH